MKFFYALAARRHRVAITPPPPRDTVAPALRVAEADIGCPTNASSKWHSANPTLTRSCGPSAHLGQQAALWSSRQTRQHHQDNNRVWGGSGWSLYKEQIILITFVVYDQKGQWREDVSGGESEAQKAVLSATNPWTPPSRENCQASGRLGPPVIAVQPLLAGCAEALLSITVSSTHSWAEAWSLSTSCLPTGSFHIIKKKCESIWPKRLPWHLTVMLD